MAASWQSYSGVQGTGAQWASFTFKLLMDGNRLSSAYQNAKITTKCQLGAQMGVCTIRVIDGSATGYASGDSTYGGQTFTPLSVGDGASYDTTFNINSSSWTGNLPNYKLYIYVQVKADTGANTGWPYGVYLVAGPIERADSIAPTISGPNYNSSDVTVVGSDTYIKTNSITISYSAIDNSGGSGIAGIWIDGTQASSTGSASKIYTSPSPFTTSAYAKDAAGNQSSTVSKSFKFDTIAPTGTIDLSASQTPLITEGGVHYINNKESKLKLTHADVGSGLAPSGSIYLQSIDASPFTPTTPTSADFNTNGLVALGASSDPISLNLTENTLNHVHYYLRDTAENISASLGHIEVYPDTQGPEVTPIKFSYISASANSPIEIDFDNPQNITAVIQFDIRDAGVGIDKWAFDVGDGALAYETTGISSTPNTLYSGITATKTFTINPYLISSKNIPANHSVAATTNSSSSQNIIEEEFSIDWTDDSYGDEFAMKCLLEYKLDGFQAVANGNEFPQECAVELEYMSEIIYKASIHDADPGPAQDPKVSVEVTNINPIEVIIFRTASNETDGTLKVRLVLQGGADNPSVSRAVGSYSIRFVEKQVAIQNEYPVFIRSIDRLGNENIHREVIPIDKSPYIYFFDFVDKANIITESGKNYLNANSLDVKLSYISGARIVERNLVLENRINSTTQIIKTENPNNFYEREYRTTLDLSSYQGAFILYLEIKDSAGKISKKQIEFNRSTVTPNVSLSYHLQTMTLFNSDGQYTTSVLHGLLGSVSNENTGTNAYHPLYRARATLDSSAPTISSLKTAPTDLLSNQIRPFGLNSLYFPEGVQPKTHTIYVHVMDICGNIGTKQVTITTNAQDLIPIGDLKSEAKIFYKDTTSTQEYQLLDKPEPRLFNTNDPGLTDNGRVIQLNKGQMIFAPYLAGVSTGKTNYTPEALPSPGDVVTTQKMKHYFNRRPNKSKEYMDTEYVDYDTSDPNENVGDVARIKDDKIVFEKTISDGNKTITIGDIS